VLTARDGYKIRTSKFLVSKKIENSGGNGYRKFDRLRGLSYPCRSNKSVRIDSNLYRGRGMAFPAKGTRDS